jgi:hypothetical protein
MKNWFAAALAISVSSSLAGGIQIRSQEHAYSIVERSDGQFDVTCLDGITEIKSTQDIATHRLCEHLRTYSGVWRLQEGGIENGQTFCDLDLNLIRSEHSAIQLRASQLTPCMNTPVETQQCSGLTCSLSLEGRYFVFDFTETGHLALTRLDDGFTAVYRGYAGPGRDGGSKTARLAQVGGVGSILQSSADLGASWYSVCDDSFGMVEAKVACRELGYSGQVTSLTLQVRVEGDADFGWDDLSCRGEETSLADCSHQPWRVENCDVGEHVQLVCAP